MHRFSVPNFYCTDFNSKNALLMLKNTENGKKVLKGI